MEINNNYNLTGLAHPSELYSNGAARVREAGRVDPTTLGAPPSAIYHGTRGEVPSIGYEGPNDYSISVESRVSESAEEYGARTTRMLNLLTVGLGTTSLDLKRGYDMVLETLSPELRKKDWGFSVSNGNIVLWENTDKLTDTERETLKTALSNFSLEYLANEVADTLIAGLQAARGPFKTTSGIGRYHLTEENFGDIIDLRAYIESHMPSGEYDWKIKHLSNEHDLSGLYWGSGLRAMIDQLADRAEPRYAEPA